MTQKTKKAETKPRKVKKKIRKWPVILVSALAALLLCAAGFTLYAVYGYDAVYPGVSVLGRDLSGMRRSEVIGEVMEQSAKNYKGKSITVSCGDKSVVITSEDLDMHENAEQAADDALTYGRDGSFFDRLGLIWKSLTDGVELTAVSMYDTTEAGKKLEAFADSLFVPVVQHSHRAVGKEVVISLGSAGYHIDIEKLKELFFDRVANTNFDPISVEKVATSPGNLDYEALRNAYYIPPSNAQLAKKNNKEYKIADAVVGRDLDIVKIKTKLQGKTSGSYRFPFQYEFPEINAEDLEPVLFNTLLGTASTTLSSTEANRTNNVRLAAEACDKVVLNPGEEYSFNNIVGIRTEARGYKNAKIFMSGEIVDGVGGGICQVSSTLYMAALMSELQIVKRTNHMFKVAYTPVGQDATVAWGALDFVFKNNTKYPILITSKLSGTTMMVEVYGTRQEVPGREVKLESKILSTIKYETKYIKSSKLKEGTSRVTQAGINGGTSETYRIVMQDGVEVSRERVNKSTYRPSSRIITVGTAPAETTAETKSGN